MEENITPPDTKNETLARLLGWEPTGRNHVKTGRAMWEHGKAWSEGCPDYTDWARFPEMQEYVRGLDFDHQWIILDHIERGMVSPESRVVLSRTVLTEITPTILRDAILEVMG